MAQCGSTARAAGIEGACFAGSSVVPSGFGENLIKQEEISKIDQIAHFLEEIFELGSAYPAPPLNPE